MTGGMHAPLAAFTLFALLAQRPPCREVSLVLPHELREGESAVLLVSVGVIPRGARIAVTTPSGRLLGTVSPYGIPAGREAGTYTVPLPAEAISGRRVAVRLSLDWNRKQRAPTETEVKDVRVTIREDS
jgi:hypothetical protein